MKAVYLGIGTFVGAAVAVAVCTSFFWLPDKWVHRGISWLAHRGRMPNTLMKRSTG
jgi:hypothetical protein